jgi:hypothetical protein
VSFLYPRTIAVHRPGAVATPGSSNVATLVTGYSGETIAAETVIYSGLPASIQYKDRDIRPTSPLPADTSRPGGWHVYIPLSANVPNGGITENDVVVDDTVPPRRYQVEAAYNNPLGWKLHCRYLKA